MSESPGAQVVLDQHNQILVDGSLVADLDMDWSEPLAHATTSLTSRELRAVADLLDQLADALTRRLCASS